MPGKKYRKIKFKRGDFISKSYTHINLTRYFIILEEIDSGLYRCFGLDDGLYDTFDADFAYEKQTLIKVEKLA